MRAKTTTIPELVMNVLQSAIVTDTGVKLQGQLDRKDYVTVNKVLDACGCKWNRKSQQHDFQNAQAKEKILAAIDGGSYTHEKSAYDFFPTPEEIADEMAENLALKSGDQVLEPSAGKGNLIQAALKCESELYIAAIDLDISKCEELKVLAIGRKCSMSIIGGDFLKNKFEKLFDAVIMNPPFSNGQDVEHVVHAMKFLKRGGRCACIVSPGYTFRDGKKWDVFRKMLDDNEVILEKELPSGTFKASGTMVRTWMLVIEKK